MDTPTNDKLKNKRPTAPVPVYYGESEYVEKSSQLPSLTSTINKNVDKIEDKVLPSENLPTHIPNLSIPVQNQENIFQNNQNSIPFLPLSLFLVNDIPSNVNPENKDAVGNASESTQDPNVNQVLKELLDVQKKNLDIKRQRLELDKERLEFERSVGSQLLAMGSFFGDLFQKFALPNEEFTERQRQSTCDIDISKESEIQETLVTMKYEESDYDESEIQNYEEDEILLNMKCEESDNDENEIHNYENSDSSNK